MEYLLYVWLAAVIPFSLIGLGNVTYILIKYINIKWFHDETANEVEIKLLRERNAILQKAYEEANQNTLSVLMSAVNK